MRLTKVTVSGFKSFADTVEFRFDEPKVGIVGPNGCGKSNVVDAVKWVLGERSAKSLRGGAMLDVIFAGSAGRKPLGMASVTLTFANPLTNPNARLPEDRRGLHIDTDEVAVARRLYRDGRSEYLINDHKVRLKDIKDLFLDTGIGNAAYCIIEQGRVAAILQASPVERRTILEEAAGVAKFKVRRVEAQRKLERTQVNLVRVREKLENTERRLRMVRGQAKKARTFQELDEQYRLFRTDLAFDQFDELQSRLMGLTSRLTDLASQRRTLEESLATLEATKQEIEIQSHELDARHRELERAAAEHSSKIEQATQRIELTKRQHAETTSQISTDRTDLQDLEKRLAETADQVEKLSKDASEAALAVEVAEAATATLTDAAAHAAHMVDQRAEELRMTRSRRDEVAATLAAARTRIDTTQDRLNSIAEARQRTAERITANETSVADTNARRGASRQSLEEARRRVENAEQDLRRHDDDATELGQRINALADSLADVRHDRAAAGSRLHLLDEMQHAHEGLGDDVKRVLEKGDPDVLGVLGDAISTQREHAELVESILGRDLEIVLVANDQAANRLVQWCREESLSLVIAVANSSGNEEHESPPDSARSALDLLDIAAHAQAVAHRLLHKSLVVDTFEQALSMAAKGWRVAARTGQLVEADGRIRIGRPAAGGWISRRMEMEELEATVAGHDVRIAALDRDLGSIRQASTEADLRRRDAAEQLQAASNRVVDLDYALQGIESDIERLQRQRRELDAEDRDQRDRVAELTTQQTQQQQAVDDASASLSSHESSIEEAESAMEAARANQHGAQEACAAHRVDLGKLSEQHQASLREARHVQAAADEIEDRCTSLREQVTRRSAQLDQQSAAIDAAAMQVRTDTNARDQAQRQMGELDEAMTTARVSLAERSRELQDAQQRTKILERDHHALELSRREAELNRENLEERITEELGLDLPAGLAAWKTGREHKTAEVDRDAAKVEIARLRDEIKALGNINLDSIEEERNLEQRNEDLIAQVADIDQAREQLESLIAELEEASKTRFAETFEAVKSHFAGPQGMFRQLFGGGSADLYLVEDEDGHVDMLESGIEIKAKPPGKEPRVISQLSGGEKTMTAVALLLAIFKSRPAPFCILDEVDAALDDANVGRFCSTIDQFLDKSHFIIITHNKQSMLTCDRLYGVTQPQRGVSKRVTVRVDEVGDGGKISQAATQRATEELQAEEPVDSPIVETVTIDRDVSVPAS
ncbi:MAG: chromosome segregation protein SMC [Phycisphaerales bacterium]|nr:chromosome segregation protein SMC [Phycisphaerales bacterium]